MPAALPHAATHPGRLATVGTFVGHSAPRVEGCDVTIAALGLTPIARVEGDLAGLAPANREFELNVADGVYSWVVPPGVDLRSLPRPLEDLLAVGCRRSARAARPQSRSGRLNGPSPVRLHACRRRAATS
jgi:hypothetical protein